MLEAKLQKALQELISRRDVVRVAIKVKPDIAQNSNDESSPLMERPLGEGAVLRIWHATLHREDLPAAVERCVRAVRTLWRLTGETLMDLSVPKQSVDPKKQIEIRIQTYLQALLGSSQASSGYVMYHGKIMATAGLEDSQRRDQLNLLSRQLDKASMSSTQSSHATLARDDLFALSFYFGAALFLFFDAPYALSFTEHRSRLVAREISPLLGAYDDPPPTPAMQNPLPES